MYIEYAKCRVYPAAVVMTSMIGSLFSPVYAAERPYQQDFVVTAYYSPLPNQCCYFRGGYEEEITFNGKGVQGADGTPVYVGMIAAPPSYGFGTRIDLPGLGVGTVHDRGGRIIEWGDDLHRIDLWMGTGEAGLARALAWGARRVTATVYPVGSEEMPPEKFSLDSVAFDASTLSSLPKVDTPELLTHAEYGESEYSVRVLQNILKELGYFPENPNGQFGDITKKALQDFLNAAGLSGDGTSVDTSTAAALTVASGIREENLPDIEIGLEKGAQGNGVRQIQKLMRFLGFYRGRTDGIFTQELKESITAFQIRHDIVAQALDPFAGRVGPMTKKTILASWKMKVVSMKMPAVAEKIRIAQAVTKDRRLPTAVLSSGSRGKDVRTLQAFLETKGYLPATDVTGTFGSRTEAALLRYQLDSKIVASEKAHGAGVFGPSTRAAATKDLIAALWNDVRANGVRGL